MAIIALRPTESAANWLAAQFAVVVPKPRLAVPVVPSTSLLVLKNSSGNHGFLQATGLNAVVLLPSAVVEKDCDVEDTIVLPIGVLSREPTWIPAPRLIHVVPVFPLDAIPLSVRRSDTVLIQEAVAVFEQCPNGHQDTVHLVK